MKLARFEAGGRIVYGSVEGQSVRQISGDIFGRFKLTGRRFDLKEVKLLPPCQPTKIVATGLNYKDHARELNLPIPQEPILFLKSPSSLVGDEDFIKYPPMVGQLDYEAELAVVIKVKAKNLTPKKAPNFILGYTCLNDVTARDIQSKDGQWTRSKCFDTFCPMGPYVVNGVNPNKLKIQLFLNGQVKQSSTTKNLIFTVEELVSFISRVMTLLPGDVIATGTPGGVGPMTHGDEVRVCIEKIGTLTNYVI